MKLDSQLQISIAALYDAFAPYPLRSYTDPCRCCHTPAAEAKLHSKPLRQLGLDELSQYVGDALLVWGNVDDFKHFLPRICELYVFHIKPESRLDDPVIVLLRFRYGLWRGWPEDEQRAVEGFLREVWLTALRDDRVWSEFEAIDTWLCAIAQVEDDLTPYLDRWINETGLAATLALSSFVLTTNLAVPGMEAPDGFWRDRDAQYKQVQQWLLTGPVRDKLSRAAAGHAATSYREELKAALLMLT